MVMGLCLVWLLVKVFSGSDSVFAMVLRCKNLQRFTELISIQKIHFIKYSDESSTLKRESTVEVKRKFGGV